MNRKTYIVIGSTSTSDIVDFYDICTYSDSLICVGAWGLTADGLTVSQYVIRVIRIIRILYCLYVLYTIHEMARFGIQGAI